MSIEATGEMPGDLKILLLEDYPPDAEIVIRQLRRDGIFCEWIRVDTERAFIEALIRFKPDLILSDYTIPGFGGLRALQTMERFPGIPLIIVTGSISEEAAVACMKQGAADYVLKGNLSRLTTAVTRALEQRRADAEHHEVEYDLRMKNAAIASAADPIVLADLQGRLTYANPAFLSVWGYEDVKEVVGKSLHAFFKHEDEADEVMADILRNGKWRGEFVGRREKGDFFFATGTMGLVLGEMESPLAIMGGFSDVTERRNLEEQLRQSQKMEALGTLAGGIAHDFNNLLAAIMGYTDMAMEDLPLDSTLFMNLEQVYLAATRASALVQQILTFSRSAEAQSRPVHLQPVLKETIKLLRGSVPPNTRIREQIDADCGRVNIDITQFHQTVMNLCVNGAHAMKPDGGTLIVELCPSVVEDERTAAHMDIPMGNYVRLSVRDSGHGMDEQVKMRIFDPFFTTKSAGEGTGLGLSTVHGIVKGSGGGIEVESRQGEGTTFHVYFPVFEAEVESERSDHPTPAYLPPVSSRKILLVDDEYAIAQVYKYSLERLGVTVDAFVEPDKALAAFRASPESYDLVLTDFVMPEKSGLDLAAEIRATDADIPIIITTGIAERLDQEALDALSICDVVPKPVGADALRRAIQRHL